MAKDKPDPVKEYLAAIGRRGGSAKVPKGYSSLSPAERKANAKRAGEARWKKVRTAEKAMKAKKKGTMK